LLANIRLDEYTIINELRVSKWGKHTGYLTVVKIGKIGCVGVKRAKLVKEAGVKTVYKGI